MHLHGVHPTSSFQATWRDNTFEPTTGLFAAAYM
jgi:hypothetical protein